MLIVTVNQYSSEGDTMNKYQEKANVTPKSKKKKRMVITHTEKLPKSGVSILLNFESVDDYLRFSRKYGK